MIKVLFKDLGLIDYKDAWEYQEKMLNEVVQNKKSDSYKNQEGLNYLFFCEHPHVYTLGKSGNINNLLINHIQMQAKNVSFYHTNRGGDITYHGPGQIVCYPIFDLEKFNMGVKSYVHALEESVILTLAHYGIHAGRLEGATGVWLDAHKSSARKICAIGVRVSRYVTMHGFAFNINTNLEYFNYINPCGFTDKAVTSLAKELGHQCNVDEVKNILKEKISDVFGIQLV